MPVPRVSADAWVTLGVVGGALLNYVYTLVLAALLAGDQFSILVAAQALMLVAGTVAVAGVPWVMAGEIARAPDRPGGPLVRFAWRANFTQGVIAAIVVAVLARGFADAVQIAFLFAATVTIFLATVSKGWAQGRQRFRLMAFLMNGEIVAKIGIGLVLVLLGGGASGAIAGGLGGSLVVLAIGLVVMRDDLEAPEGDPPPTKALVRSAMGMAAVQAAVTGAAVLDVLLVVALLPAGPEVSSYTLAAILGRAPVFLGVALSTTVFPALTADPGNRALVRRSLQRLSGLVLPLIAIGATVPAGVLTFVLPDEYAAAHTYLAYTMLIGSCYAIASLQVGWLKAVGAFGLALRRLAAGALVALVLIVVGSQVDDVTGLAIGASIGALVMLALLGEAAGRMWPGAQRPSRESILLGIGAAVLLIPAGLVPILWVVLATAILLFICWRSLLRVEDGP